MKDLELMEKVNQLTRRVEELERNTIDFAKELYTVPQVAGMLGLTREAVYHMIKRGELPTIKLGTIKVRRYDLLKVIYGDKR